MTASIMAVSWGTDDIPEGEAQPPAQKTIDRGFGGGIDIDPALLVDPLERLFNAEFTPTTWNHELSYVGDLPGKLHPKQVEKLEDRAIHRWLFWGNQCTVAGTRVLTERGAIPCEEVEVGDVVLGPNDQRQQVVRTYRSPAPVPVFRVRTHRGIEITTNAEHPLCVAGSKRVGDWYDATVPDESTARFLEVGSILPGAYVRLGMRSSTRGASDWPREALITEDDAYFLGLMTGDGWWHHRAGRMSIVASERDVATIEWMEGYLRGRGIRPARTARRLGTIGLHWCNLAFKRLVASWGVHLGKAATKHVPECIWRGDKKAARAFLRGVYDTDGCASLKPAVILISTSERLVRDVQLLLARWGLAASLTWQDAPQGGFANAARRFRLTLNGAKSAQFKRHIGFRLARKHDRLPDLKNRHCGVARWDRIDSIEPVGCATVYGFTCPPGHVFYGNGLLNHNSGKTSLGAIDVSLVALGRHPLQQAGLMPMPPVTCWASGLSWELWEKILLPELLSWLPRWRVISHPPPFRPSTNRDIVVLADNGKESRITGKAANQGAETYQSARVHLVWLDEEHPESVWDEMQPRLLRFGGRTIATMTPLKGMSWPHGRVYEPVKTGRIPTTRHSYSHAGTADNPSISPEAVAEMSEELKHNPSQLESRLYGHFTRPQGAVLPWDPALHQTADEWTIETPEYVKLLERGVWRGALDLGKWGFALCFGAADHEGVFTMIDEYFSQNEDADTRAKGMNDLLRAWKVPDTISIPADCADPKGIKELNAALERIESKYRVYAIPGELKKKTTGIARVESMLNRRALRVRRGMGRDRVWYVGRNASSFGKPILGSRWMWEAANWQYPKTPDGKVQKDEPDDATADGAHMMDANRYLIVSYYGAEAPAPPKKHPTTKERIQKEMEAMDQAERDQQPNEKEKWGNILRQG